MTCGDCNVMNGRYHWEYLCPLLPAQMRRVERETEQAIKERDRLRRLMERRQAEAVIGGAKT